MSEQTKITDLLNPLCLQQLYEGEESRILLIFGKKQISDRYIRLRVRDARHQDNAVCDVKEVLVHKVCVYQHSKLAPGSETWARVTCGKD